MGDKSDKKKIQVTDFFMRIHIWNVKTLAYMVLNLCYAQQNNKIKWHKIAKGHNSNISFNWLNI